MIELCTFNRAALTQLVRCLCPGNISGNIRTGTDLWQCAHMITLQYFPIGKSGRQHHDLISHSVTLSWHWANESLPYPDNAEQVSILRSLVWFNQVSNPQGPDSNQRGSDSPIFQHGRSIHSAWSNLIEHVAAVEYGVRVLTFLSKVIWQFAHKNSC